MQPISWKGAGLGLRVISADPTASSEAQWPMVPRRCRQQTGDGACAVSLGPSCPRPGLGHLWHRIRGANEPRRHWMVKATSFLSWALMGLLRCCCITEQGPVGTLGLGHLHKLYVCPFQTTSSCSRRVSELTTPPLPILNSSSGLKCPRACEHVSLAGAVAPLFGAGKFGEPVCLIVSLPQSRPLCGTTQQSQNRNQQTPCTSWCP